MDGVSNRFFTYDSVAFYFLAIYYCTSAHMNALDM